MRALSMLNSKSEAQTKSTEVLSVAGKREVERVEVEEAGRGLLEVCCCGAEGVMVEEVGTRVRSGLVSEGGMAEEKMPLKRWEGMSSMPRAVK